MKNTLMRVSAKVGWKRTAWCFVTLKSNRRVGLSYYSLLCAFDKTTTNGEQKQKLASCDQSCAIQSNKKYEIHTLEFNSNDRKHAWISNMMLVQIGSYLGCVALCGVPAGCPCPIKRQENSSIAALPFGSFTTSRHLVNAGNSTSDE